MKKKQLKNISVFILIWTVFGLFSEIEGSNSYEYYLGQSITSATLSNVDDQTGTTIGPSYDADHVLNNFKTVFSVAATETHILVEIKNRGASQILVAINEGATAANVFSSSEDEILNIDATDMDYGGAERVENFHLVSKSGTAGFLTILCNEPYTTRQPTTVNIKSISPPSGTTCPYSCVEGTCESGLCKCKESHFGTQCNKLIRLMDSEITTFEVNVPPFQHFSLIESVEKGDKDITLTMISKQSPKSTLLVNESDTKDINFIMKRVKGSKSSVIFDLTKLQQTGKSEKTIIAEKDWIYFNFQNHEKFPVVIQVTAERVKDNTLSTIAYILYMIIMCTIVILFVLILCVACIKKRNDESDTEDVDIRRQFEQEEESEAEEEEDPITLKEEDYDRFFPIVDIIEHNSEGKLNEEICSICIDKILNGEKVRKIKYCSHYFHSGCLTDWIKVNETCPNCKLEMDRKNLLKLEKAAEAAEEKKQKNRVGLIDPEKKRLVDSPNSSSKKLKKEIPNGPNPNRMRSISRNSSQNHLNEPTNIRVISKQTADVIQNIDEPQPNFDYPTRMGSEQEITNNSEVPIHQNNSNISQNGRIRRQNNRPMSRRQPGEIPMGNTGSSRRRRDRE